MPICESYQQAHELVKEFHPDATVRGRDRYFTYVVRGCPVAQVWQVEPYRWRVIIAAEESTCLIHPSVLS
jgi:hypothetical protein